MHPHSDIGPPAGKKRFFWRGKIKKKSPKFFLRLRDTYKKYILQKNWSKTAIPALSSGPSNLQQSIWGRHHQLDDQHRNPNMNNKDHLVGQLTMSPHHSDQMSQWTKVSRIALCIAKVKVSQ